MGLGMDPTGKLEISNQHGVSIGITAHDTKYKGLPHLPKGATAQMAINKLAKMAGSQSCIENLVLISHANPVSIWDPAGMDVPDQKLTVVKKTTKTSGPDSNDIETAGMSGLVEIPEVTVEQTEYDFELPGWDVNKMQDVSYGNAGVFGVALRKQLRFCRPCTIWLGGCRTAGPAAQLLANGSGCDVFGTYKAKGPGIGGSINPKNMLWSTPLSPVDTGKQVFPIRVERVIINDLSMFWRLYRPNSKGRIIPSRPLTAAEDEYIRKNQERPPTL